MWHDEFYQKPNGRAPANEWLEEQTTTDRARIRSAMEALREEGIEKLEGSKRLERLIPITKRDKSDPPLYELKVGQLRVCTYFDRERGAFIYFNGWKKQKPIQRDYVDNCRKLLRQYLFRKGL